ncbi:hypothetical protein [Methylobacterium platani]|uniref:Uncharacterized protein n=2 Tax=Methylobacterium platani TaxID=427683 RepID=A0A179S072_9HYPH|nr:hypothetical protein [Methylobacterium platani]KMO11702.1 hypothetical protein SQ03_26330 [Methylobacterium platani JCM 14648]OAS18477.1 hypothetical protein A5481_26315 [Methylobacterium platani]
MDWGAAAYRARRQIAARARIVPEQDALALIDVFADRGSVTIAELRRHGPADVVAAVLGHVTTAVHGRGHVPVRNGWYRRDETGTGYVIDPGFAVAWRAARACDAPLSPGRGAG